MKKTALLFTILLLSLTHLSAQQTGTIRGTLIDHSTSEAIPGAVVEVTSLADTTQVKHYTSVAGGAISIPATAYGDYTLRISFLGYEDLIENVKVNRPAVNLGQLAMKQGSVQIGVVVTEAQAMRTSQKGDTVIYNASSFKVAKDADAEALLSKMPGITVVDGEVEAQGETVKKVFVDGKEFFGQDVNTTIKNLPAEMIQQIEVYNKLSDQAEFSGVDDGEGFKAINIVTNVKSAQFGKVYAGWGIEDKYIVGANMNFFAGDHRFSVLGMANNMNQQNFAMEDILGAVGGGGHGRGGMRSSGRGMMRGAGGGFMVGQQDGTSTVQSFGLNYQGQWGKKIEATASYFFNNSDNTNNSETEREYIDGSDWRYNGYSTSHRKNTEHRFNSRIDYKINENHSLMMRPSLSLQRYKSDSWSNSVTQAPDANGVMDFYSGSYNYNDSKNWGYNLSNSLIYRVKLGKPGRTLTTDVGGSVSKNDRDGFSISNLHKSATDSTYLEQKSDTKTLNYSLNGSVIYTEPVSQYSQLTAMYRVRYNYSDSDKGTEVRSDPLDEWDAVRGLDYSSKYNSDYLTHSVGPGFNYRKERNNVTANVSFERATLNGDSEYPSVYSLSKSFDNLTYFVRMEQNWNSRTTLRLMARSSTSNPSITQLQDVIDMSNLTSITGGNPDLKQTYQHTVWANLVNSAVEKGRTFMVSTNVNISSNYIADDIHNREGWVLPNGETLARGSQYRTYTNLDGYWEVSLRTSYGFPVKFLRSNLNFNLDGRYRESPSYINDQKNMQKGQYYNGGLVLGSNISERIDFTLMYNAGYNIVNNSVNDDNNNEYMSQYASLRLKWVAWAGLTLSTTTSWTQNRGITDDYNDQYVMCNVALGKKVFRSQRGEISLNINDLFNQKTSFRRNVTTEYLENVKSNVIGRFYSLQFVYNLRNYGKQRSSGSRRGPGADTLGPPMGPGGGMPMGPPPGRF